MSQKSIAFTEWAKKLPQLFKDEKKIRIIIAVGLLGILLILLSEMVPWGKQTEQNETNETITISSEVYTRSLENKLAGLIGRINGAGNTSVAITLEQGVEYVYAREEKKTVDQTEQIDSDRQNKTERKDSYEYSYITVEGEDGREEVLIQTEKQPEILGVVVVCEGGGNAAVREQIINAATTLFSIPSSRVFVTEGKG
ncbi:MAG: hypothetical protein IJY82_03525 [Oscillospiraceae bacterium]|nr:hypothetical protein [Oscillospiraceae bacterium]